MRENFTSNRHMNFNCWQEQSLHFNAALSRFSYKRRSKTHFPDEMYGAFPLFLPSSSRADAAIRTGPGMVKVWKDAGVQYPVQSQQGYEPI